MLKLLWLSTEDLREQSIPQAHSMSNDKCATAVFALPQKTASLLSRAATRSKYIKGSKERYLDKDSLQIFGVIPFVKLQYDT